MSTQESRPELSGFELRQRLAYSDEALLAECRIDTYRSSGPGGQHRNKVSSAIRLRHERSGLVATGTGSRSQHENKARALSRLREAIALAARAPLPCPVTWPENVLVRDGRLRVSERNPSRHEAVALVLDALVENGLQPRPAAEALGLTSSSLTRFLLEHPKAWVALNQMRAERGLPPLRS
ncbi:MAG: peptide chain release factor-like protein [Phycisphaerae bacterium]|jgi:hypothetical protein|nr:peptide chain release factor-like protein [Phycisphaerae bacterium]MCZ2400512.1 peptide chain release factor-like protein [Phycisphaerae bacterium]NUQ49977.1 peptide chain release factor-like protein [Phycisphaerae bacterium]